jgi:hypothetical protein
MGPSTVRSVAALGYKVECSTLPYNDLRADGGPDFRVAPDQPYWLDEAARLLEVPATTGFIGKAPRLGPPLCGMFDSPVAAKLHLPGLLSRTGTVARSRLTPEGVSASEQCRLLDGLIRSGRRTFSMAYHSPSLAPGNTPYVRNQADLDRFLATIEEVLTYFRDVIGGRFTTISAIHARMSAQAGIQPTTVRRTPTAEGGQAAPRYRITVRWARRPQPQRPGAPPAADRRRAYRRRSCPGTSAAPSEIGQFAGDAEVQLGEAGASPPIERLGQVVPDTVIFVTQEAAELRLAAIGETVIRIPKDAPLNELIMVRAGKQALLRHRVARQADAHRLGCPLH